MEEINLGDLFAYIFKKSPLMLLIASTTIILGIIYMVCIQKPLYHGITSVILVQQNNETTGVTQSDLNVNEKLVSTYSEIIKSRRVLSQVISELKLDSTIEELAKNKKVVGIGEIGLDYYWNKENKDLQQFAFIKQIELANHLNLPIVIHTREAVMDTLEILKKYPVNKKGVFHCCPLNIELIKEALKLGFYISFAGPVTFKNAKNAD